MEKARPGGSGLFLQSKRKNMKAKNRIKLFTGWDTAVINGKTVQAYYQDYNGYEYVCKSENEVYEDQDGDLVLFPGLTASEIGCTAFKNDKKSSSFLEKISKWFNSPSSSTNQQGASGVKQTESNKVGLQGNSTLMWVGIGAAVLAVVLILVFALKK